MDRGDRKEIRLSGTGGQGIILAGILLAEAAGVHEARFVVQTQSYGPEARGGASRTDVIISRDEILHSQIDSPDVLLCLSQEAFNRFGRSLKPDGLLIIDPLFVREEGESNARTIKIEATRIAGDLGNRRVANMVALGALEAASKATRKESLIRALVKRVPARTVGLNLEAFTAGYDYVAEQGGLGS
ncbi:MAG: 2-oxoacid:acceptor oxidoreductase family protein [Bacillota bacterium]